MKELLIATGNKGKFPEIVAKLSGVPFQFLNLRDVNVPEGYEVEESAQTFEGNAIIKAMTWGHKTGKMVLAEDAGLEVDALDGRPGVYSARYALGSDKDRYEKLLDEMKDVPDDQRGAQFRAVVAIYDPNTEKIRTCDGVFRGRILREPHGDNGFGYDPVFFSDELDKTSAEVTLEEKNAVSHRGKALGKAKEILVKEFTE